MVSCKNEWSFESESIDEKLICYGNETEKLSEQVRTQGESVSTSLASSGVETNVVELKR